MTTKAELQARITELEAELADLRRRDRATACREGLAMMPTVQRIFGHMHQRWIWDTPWGLFQADADGLPPAELVDAWERRRTA